MIDAIATASRPRLDLRLPETSLIVPTRHRSALVHDTLVSVLAGDEVPTEIIVVDQSDLPDAAVQALAARRPTIRYIHAEARGAAYARNMGMRAAAYPVLVLTDDDVRVTPGWFGALVRALLAGPRRGVVTGRIVAAAEIEGGFAPSTHHEDQPITYQGRIGRDVLYTGAMALYRSAIDEVGGFDERLGPGSAFPAAEDNDLGFRLLERGYTIRYVPEAVLYHRAWRSSRDYPRLRWRYGVGQGAFYAKHLRSNGGYMLARLARDIGRHVGRLPRHVIRGSLYHLKRDAWYAGGLTVGAVRWTLQEGREAS